ncbi:MAG: hypothetical protein LM632_05560, partial [Armatimonadetes bacterium]|nr:hypothetical protein [Armatimonadota bacterium]
GLIIGALTCWLLIKLRLTFVGFPLHPLGFVAWYGWPIDRYWLSIFIGWALKSAILRYGGYRTFHKFRPSTNSDLSPMGSSSAGRPP